MDASKFLFFDSAKEVSNDVNTFLNLRFIRNRNKLFFEKIYANELKVKVSLNIPDTLSKIVLRIT